MSQTPRLPGADGVMRAIGIARFGGPEVLQIVERPAPKPGPGEVRIRVAAATVNPTDTVLRSGRHGAPDGLEPRTCRAWSWLARSTSPRPGQSCVRATG